jgi:hypothetical protein
MKPNPTRPADHPHITGDGFAAFETKIRREAMPNPAPKGASQL